MTKKISKYDGNLLLELARESIFQEFKQQDSKIESLRRKVSSQILNGPTLSWYIGLTQRARALILQPKVMLFDEPLSNLDSKLRRQMREDIRRLQQELGVTSVYVTHDQDEALAVSDDVIVMKDGKIAQQGSPKLLYLQPNSKFVATFMGDANIIKGEVIATGEKSQLRIDEVVIGTDKPMAENLTDKTIEVAVRPEALSLTSVDDKVYTGLLSKILTKSYIGRAIEYSVQWNNQELFLVSATGTQEFNIGDAAKVVITPPGIAPITTWNNSEKLSTKNIEYFDNNDINPISRPVIKVFLNGQLKLLKTSNTTGSHF